MNLVLKGGKVHSNTQGGFILADLRIKNDKIVEIAPNLQPQEGERVIDCSNKYVLPGVIDSHVHFREPGADHKEDWLSGSKAAVVGGVTTVLDMPNNNPPTTTQERLTQKRELAKKSLVNYGLYVLGCIENKDMLGNFTNIPGYKVYLGSSTGNYLTDDLGVFAQILENATHPVVVHAEHEDLLKLFAQRYKETKLHHKMRDNICAVVSMAEATTMSEYFNKQLHIAHMSTKQEVEFLRKNKTPNMSCEVSPHHLFLNEQFHVQKGTYGKMNPPLRYKEDQEALWEGIRDGIVDMVATDHAPHLKEEKNQDFFSAPCGVPGVQTMLPLLLNAVHQDKLSLLDVVRLSATNPARIFKIHKRGSLEVGNYADICVVDMQKEQQITDLQQYSKCAWSPFSGMNIKGWPVMTIVNGKVVFDHGHIKEEVKGKECEFGAVSNTMRYDINKSFEDNKKEGPYGFENIKDQNPTIQELLGEYGVEKDFFGYKTKLPLGVAAGPLFNSKYMKAAAMDGFSVITWKTFRSEHRLAHRNDGSFLGHNIVFLDLDRTLQAQEAMSQLSAHLEMDKPGDKITITNSFGMGSDEPLVWKQDVANLLPWMKENNKCTIASVVASPKPDWTPQMLADDYARTAKEAQDAGERIIELNFSCPNVGKCKEGSVFKNPCDAMNICRTVRSVLNPGKKLLIKIGYNDKASYRELLSHVAAFVDGVVAINTVPMKVVDKDGRQALPGGLVTGTCGHAIIDVAVEAVKSLVELRDEMKLDIKIFGCGGVTSPQAFMKHIDAGADFVFCATAALFNPSLPVDVARFLKENRVRR